MWRARLVLLGCGLLAACSSERPSASSAAASNTPPGGHSWPAGVLRTWTFDGGDFRYETPVGRTGSYDTYVRNVSDSVVHLALSAPPPFHVYPAALDVPPHDIAQVSVVFAPEKAGFSQGMLQLTGGGREDGASLEGTGVENVVCTDDDPCMHDAIDAVSGECHHTWRAEGTACDADADPCVTRACHFGACVRVAVPEGGACVGLGGAGTCAKHVCRPSTACDDANTCTLDFADGAGCRHEPRDCTIDLDPCQAALCDPVTGCAGTPVADGTSCGETGCFVRGVCSAGRCVNRMAVDGEECENPCGVGHCRKGSCDADAMLEPVWHHRSSDEGSAWSGGPLAEDGTSAFVEKSGSDENGDDVYDFLTVSRDGVETSRKRLDHVFAGAFVLDGRLVALAPGAVEARTTTGDLVWHVDAGDAWANALGDRPNRAWFGTARRDPGGFLTVAQAEFGRDARFALFAFTAEGVVRWHALLDRKARLLAVDEDGASYLALSLELPDTPPRETLVSHGPDGRERWRRELGAWGWRSYLPLEAGVFGGRIAVGSDRFVRDARTGDPVGHALPFTPWTDGFRGTTAVLDDRAMFVTGDACIGDGCPADARTGTSVFVVDPARGALRGHVRAGEPMSFTLTDRGTLLFLDAYRDDPTESFDDTTWTTCLREVDRNGRELSSRELRLNGAPTRGPLRLHGNRLFVDTLDNWMASNAYGWTEGFVAFDVPDLPGLASHGWIQQDGRADGAGTPIP